ncbi:hypothetical protein ACFY2V_39955 [Streptomyces eurythermus]|uniref:hypothetical protein n=1 Tax=Streptomyces eurythermus TaxID=42237 RepID=UPI00368BBBAA
MDLLELIRRPIHLHAKADDLAIGFEGAEVTVGGKPSRWLLEPGPARDTFMIHSVEEPALAWTALEGTSPLRIGLLPPHAPGLSDFRFVPVAGEEDTYEILHGQDKGVAIHRPDETGRQPLTLLGIPSACRILVTLA